MAVASTARRRFVVASLAGVLFVCAAAGGGVWYALRCDRRTYQNQASVSWVNNQEEYLFACGSVWHSLDTGQTWKQIPTLGLPFLAREGRMGVDRTVGRLYLALILAAPSTLDCLLCPLSRVQPVMYMSEDGGQHWKAVARFPQGASGITRFRGLSADPDYSDAAWTILVTGERVVYYATNNGGRSWRLTCEERLGYSCDPPSE